MKTQLLLSLFISSATFVFGGTEKNVNSKITNVTVYFDKAAITRTADLVINPGITTLVFDKISPEVIDKTMQAQANGGFQIIDVKHDVRYVEPSIIQKTELPRSVVLKIEQLRDSVFFRKLELQKITAKRVNLEKEMDIIMKNKLYTGIGKSDTMPVLKEMMGFYRTKMDEIQEELYKIKVQEYKADKMRGLVQNRLDQLQNYQTQTEQPDQESLPIHCILVTVSSEQSVSGNITLNYLVNGAGWEPGYDLRSENSKKALTITYKANVYQNTGEDWSSVRLKLSTFANNAAANEKPSLLKWVLEYFTYKTQNNFQLNTNIVTNGSMNTSMPTITGGTTTIDPVIPVSTDDLTGFFNSVEFDMKAQSTIPSDGKKILMVIQNKSVPVNYSFYMAPKLNKNSFLIASIPNWSDLNLLPSLSNIYVNDTYMGETTIETGVIEDTLDIGMGKDEEIICSRKKIKDVEKSTVLGSTKVRTITIEMLVKNNKQYDVNLALEDQVPVSGDKTIVIDLLDKSDAEHNVDTGSLLWKLNLKAKQSKKVTFTYTIEYSKDKKI